VNVYRRGAGGWTFETSLALQDPGGVWSVECLSADGFLLAVGIDQRLLGGQVELFVRNGDVWESNTAFSSSDRAPYDRFAWVLDVSEGRLVVGAPDHDENCSVFDTDCQSGAAYVFRAQDASSSFCDAADGSLAACPCSAMPGLPDSGCEVGGLTGGVRLDVITAETSPQNHAVLVGAGYPVTSTPASIVLRSSYLETSALAFGDGLRCVGPAVRLGAAFAIGGTSTHTFGHETSAGPGLFYYQLWFRSEPGMFCTPAAFNASNGRVLSW